MRSPMRMRRVRVSIGSSVTDMAFFHRWTRAWNRRLTRELHGWAAAPTAGGKAILLLVPVVEFKQQLAEHDGGEHGDDDKEVSTHRRHASEARSPLQEICARGVHFSLTAALSSTHVVLRSRRLGAATSRGRYITCAPHRARGSRSRVAASATRKRKDHAGSAGLA